MSDTDFSRPGQTNLSGSDRALFYKKFSGEVLATFVQMNRVAPLVRQRSIASGKSAGFQVLGRAVAFFHSAGKDISDTANNLLSQIAGAERVINIDSMLMSAVTIYDLDEAMSEWEVRGPYARELGRSVAVMSDRLAIHTLILAARASATITGLNGGSVVVDAAMKTSGVALANALFAAKVDMDHKDVPEDGRFAVITWDQHANLIRDPSVSIAATSPTVTQATVGYPLINGDLSQANGDYAKAKLYFCAGFMLVPTNHLPSTNITSGDADFGTSAGGASEQGNVYYGDFSNTAGVCFQSEAAGRLMLRDAQVESSREHRLKGWLTSIAIAQGLGILRPECSVELAIA
jgi:hypothetical protein